MRIISCLILLATSALIHGCSASSNTGNAELPVERQDPEITTSATSFSYPIGKSGTVTEAKDKDEWYNAQDIGENTHLGEDWNKNTGGDTDCGEPVYAAANGRVVFAQDAGPGWGNVVIIEHRLPSGERVQSLYGHMKEIIRHEGEIKEREKIGTVGNANGRYPCHLHFEIRTRDCPMWDQAGPGYSTERDGWTDPSDFIDNFARTTDH